MISDKIMVIDDDPKVISSVKLVLNEYEVLGFLNGKKALVYLKKPNEVNLILLDVCMRELDGINILGHIKKIKKDIVVIMMTAYGSMDIVIQALRSRADDFIEKPFKINELRSKIKLLLKEKSLTLCRSNHEDDRVERIKRFVERNYTNMSLKSVANEMSLSSKYISRLFNRHNDSSYRNYKLNIKMDKAKKLLVNTSMTVYEISYQLGYQNPESFMRIFKRKTDFTPSEYREKNRQKRKRSQ